MYTRHPDHLYCHNNAEDCHFPARIGIASIYDIEFDDMAKIMDAHGLQVIYGTFIFSPMTLIYDYGMIYHLKAYYVVDREADTIAFSFVGDSSTSYCHRFSQYLMYVTRHTIRWRDKMYLYELKENRKGIQIFEFTEVTPMARVDARRLQRNIWRKCLT
ncbi:hypothetical protein TELCIR_18614 [Teladorsagia circumcincta]|uniref:Alphavirus-like MT domain-containing protein n=1 Tax=Teladorsagia circumcincta TaxID=45464 RepID=A0A2G9TPI2_TELCI|nr:hypothetical protein TELCIR_18614 [Teladorsagia circumcincta]